MIGIYFISCVITTGPTADPTVIGVTDESYTMTIEKFKTKAFKNFTAQRQVSYLCNNLRKPLSVSVYIWCILLTNYSSNYQLPKIQRYTVFKDVYSFVEGGHCLYIRLDRGLYGIPFISIIALKQLLETTFKL